MKKPTKHKASRYSEAQTTRWLSWMAKNMQRHRQTVFLIEDLQVSWLTENWERKLHWASSIIFSGLMVGLIMGLIIEPIVGFLVGLIVGLIVGLSFSIGKNSQIITTTESTHWSWKNLKSNCWVGLKTGALRGLIFGGIVGLIAGFYIGLPEGLSIGLTDVLIGGLIGGLIGIFSAGWENIIAPTTTIPNEGMKLTIKSSGTGLIFGLLFGLLFQWLFFELTDTLVTGLIFDQVGWPINRLEDWLIVGLISGLIGGLWFGGIAVIRHYTLRLLIYLRGYGPWNYVDFLDYAVDELQFLQRVGGGYIFIHRMLLEHFAGMEDEKAPAHDELKESSEFIT